MSRLEGIAAPPLQVSLKWLQFSYETNNNDGVAYFGAYADC